MIVKKYKIKESVKDTLACIGIILLVVVGLTMISLRSQQLDKKMTDMSVTQISQNN